MNSILEYFTGLDTMTDQVVAMDFLITAKSGIKTYAVAITESATPEIRTLLHKHLEENIETHEKITHYMMQRGFYHPYDVNEQLKLDRQNANTAVNIPSLS